MKKPRVLIADDHKIVLEGLRSLLQSEFDLVRRKGFEHARTVNQDGQKPIDVPSDRIRSRALSLGQDGPRDFSNRFLLPTCPGTPKEERYGRGSCQGGGRCLRLCGPHQALPGFAPQPLRYL